MKSSLGISMVVAVLAGVFSTVAAARGDLDRTKRPAGKPAPKIQLPEIQKAVLDNGLRIWLVEQHELPTVAFNLVIQAGSDHDPVAQPGIASMTADVLDEGTKTRSSLQISEDVESIGASFSTSAGIDGSFATLSTLTKHLDKALSVYTDVIANPTFPETEFARLQKQRIAALIQQHDQPPAIANNAFSYILYGPNHPYGNNPAGTEASLKSMSTADLVKFYKAYYRPNNATLIVVGDVTMKDILPKLNSALANWTSAEVNTFKPPTPAGVERMRVYLIDKPGAPQSEVRIGYPALPRSIRERHGFTYGAFTTFRFQKGIGPFIAQGGIVSEKTDSSLREFISELNLMREKGLTAEELSYANKGMIGSFALAFETPAQIAAGLQNIVLYGLPEDYYKNYLLNIEAVSLDEARRVANQYLDTSKMAIVVVGDLTRIKESIAALKLGDIVICDTDGKPLP
ncbi:MAG: insulinase family protein [Ignavibacteria bacterium]|nr:MAG: insulinase family protein [Ignavibacteria bacterium]